MSVTITCENCGISVTRPKGDEGRGRFCSIKCGRAMQTRPSREDRFWKKVEKSEDCWLWVGARTKPIPGRTLSYGTIRSGPRDAVRTEMAHRVSYELHYGPIPDGRFVCHRCDVPLCVNPAHLFLGTAADNAHDRDAKGRQRTMNRRLTPYMVREIRRRRAAGEKLRVLAADYGTTTGHISSIARRRWWANLPD